MKKRVSLLIVLTMMVSLTGCNPKKTTMEHYLENVDAKYAYNISKALAEDDDLLSNMNAFVGQIIKIKPATAKGEYIKNISISSTMGPGIKIDTNSFDK